MTISQKITFTCTILLQICFFYASLLWWGFQLDPLMYELYMFTPFVIFGSVTFFLALFIVRCMGSFSFMPKTKLKAILFQDNEKPLASEIFLRFFSVTFAKRTVGYLGLFVGEFILRLFAIKIFLDTINLTAGFWDDLANSSVLFTNILLFVTAFSIMELPAFLLFYRLSFKGFPNRMPEYRFGLKLSLYVGLIIALRYAMIPLSSAYSFTGIEYVILVLQFAVFYGIWYLMYRKKCCCCCQGKCVICNKIKSLFARIFCSKKEVEQAELLNSIIEAEKFAETIIETESPEKK